MVYRYRDRLPTILVVLNRWRVDVAAFFMIVVLGLAQYLGFGVLGDQKSPQQALLAISGFGQPVVVTLIGSIHFDADFDE